MKPEIPQPMYTVTVSYGGGRAGKSAPPLTEEEIRKLAAERMHPVWRPMIRVTKPKPPQSESTTA